MHSEGIKIDMQNSSVKIVKYSHNEDKFKNTPPVDEYPFWITQCGITFPDNNYHEIRLDSDVSCIEYIISGSGVINSNKKSFIVSTGDTYMLQEGNEHNYYSDPNQPFHKIWFNFRGVLSKELIKIYKLQDTVLFKNLNTMPLIEEMHQIYRSTQDTEVIKTEASRLFLKIIQFLAQNQQQITTTSSPVDMIRYYIDCNITKNIKLSDISDITHYTPPHIIRIFKSKFGITPHQYIIDSKIRIAISMLQVTDKPIEDISNELSFSDPHHFSYLFEKKTGMRPLTYRREFIKNMGF